MSKLNPDVFEEIDENGDRIGTWCIPGSKPNEALCCFCNSIIITTHHGVTAVKRHAKKGKHQEKCNLNRKEDGTLKKPTQLRFNSNEVNSKRAIMCTQADKTLAAEVLFTFTVASSNISYAYGDVASKLFPKMFTDSQIAKDFSCGRKKLSYMISDGIGIHINKELKNEIVTSGNFYSLQIDESPISEKCVKQLDVNIRFFSENQQEIISHHLESFHIGSAKAQNLFEKLQDSLIGLPSDKLLNVFTDGPNVMKSLKKKIEETYPNVLDIGTCNLHVIHNGFAKGLENFCGDIEGLIIDLHYFFKRSATQSEKLREMQVKLGLPEHVLLRHVDNRWLTLNLSIQRFIEQFSVLQEFFSGKKETETIEVSKFKKICEAFSSKTLLAKALFLKNISDIFVKIQNLFQRNEPLVHILYDEHDQLLRTLMGRFLKAQDYSSVTDLSTIDVEKGEFWLNIPEVGADTEFELKKISKSEKKSFYLGARSFYINCTKYLLNKLPLQNRLLKNLKCLHPLYITEPSSVKCLKAITTVTQFIIPPEKVSGLIDEWLRLQTEDLVKSVEEKSTAITQSIEEDDYDDNNDNNKNDDESNAKGYSRIDHFWKSIFQIKDHNNSPKYTLLSILIKALLTLAHGNADCERGFSINNSLLESRSRLSIYSINGLRQIKSHMERLNNDFDELKIDRDLLNAAKNSRKNYQDRLDKEKSNLLEKRKLSPTANKLQELIAEEKELQNKLLASQSMLNLAESHIAEGLKKKEFNLIESGNVLLKEANEKIPILNQRIKENKEQQLKLQEPS